jgi:signal transduction histidine kinase/DNA-binding response OmpR family regulator
MPPIRQGGASEPAPGAPSAWEKFDPNIVIAVLLAVITFFGALYAVAKTVDAVALSREQAQVRAALNDTIQALAAREPSNLDWDDAVENLNNHFNLAWVTTNIGHYFCGTQGFDFVYALNPRDRPVYAMVGNRDASIDGYEAFRADAEPLLRDVRAREDRRGPFIPPFKTTSDISRPIQSSQVVRRGAQLYVLIATLVQPDNGRSLPAGPRSSIVVTGKKIDDALLGDIARGLVLRDLRIIPPDAPAKAFIDLKGPAGEMLGRLAWAPTEPGSTLTLVLMVPMLLVVVLPLGLFYRGNRLARRAKVLEEERRLATASAQAKSDFLANMSHEIRTPMNGVLAMLEILEGTRLDGQQTRMVGTISSSARSLLGILNDILDHSKMEAGQLDIERIACDPVEIVETTTRLFLGAAAAKQISLRCFVAPSVRGQYFLDPVRIQQILSNLVSNAIKFTMVGDVTIVVDIVLGEGGRNLLRIVTVDTGIGISPEMQNKLFQPFTQADESTARRFGGTGLGLSICRRLVELMGGQISLESIEGKGTRVALTLPGEMVEGPTGARPSYLKGIRVALVTSDLTERTHFEAYLSYWGASVSVMTLDAFEARPPPEPSTVVLAPYASMAEAIRIVRARRDPRPGPPRRFVFYAHHDLAVDAYPADDTIVTTALSRARIVAAVAVAAGRKSPETEITGTVETRATVLAPSREEAVGQGRLILLAEDHPVNREVILRQLKTLGYAADAVEDGYQALGALSKGEYALLLTDCHLPEMDGYTLTRRIRAEEKWGAHLPIIAITANAMKGEAETCFEAGMDDYLAKPVQLKTLQERLEHWLPGAAAKRVSPGGLISTATPNRDAVLDMDDLRQQFGDDRQALGETLNLFLTTLKEDLAGLTMALQGRNATEVEMLAHNRRGPLCRRLAPGENQPGCRGPRPQQRLVGRRNEPAATGRRRERNRGRNPPRARDTRLNSQLVQRPGGRITHRLVAVA